MLGESSEAAGQNRQITVLSLVMQWCVGQTNVRRHAKSVLGNLGLTHIARAATLRVQGYPDKTPSDKNLLRQTPSDKTLLRQNHNYNETRGTTKHRIR